MADYLGQSQANVSRMESGQGESGAVKRLLDFLESQHAADQSVEVQR